MGNDTIVSFSDPAFRDELSDLVREGARRIIRQAVEGELKVFLEGHATERDAPGRRAVVRNGYQPEREVLTGIGAVQVQVPKTRDRTGEGRCFRSELLPPYLKKAKRLEAVLPWLYLKGVSTNDFDEALKGLFGESVKGLSPATIVRLKQSWEAEYGRWRARDWRGHEFVYFWADGIYVNVRSEQRRCLLVVIGCDAHGHKHFLAIEEGFRESTESWKALLLSLRDRGLKIAPKLAVGDGAMGFWAALAEVFPTTRAQRCWVHKTVNVLDKLPKTLQGPVKSALHEIWQADSRVNADQAFHRHLRSEVSEGGGLPRQGSRAAARLLRFPRRALAASAHDQSDRVDVCNDPVADGENEKLSEREKRTELGSPAGDERTETLAQITRLPPAR